MKYMTQIFKSKFVFLPIFIVLNIELDCVYGLDLQGVRVSDLSGIEIGRDKTIRNIKIKPLHEAELQRLFPEAKHPCVGPLTEIAGQILQKWNTAKRSLTSYKTIQKLLPIVDWLPPYLRSSWKKYILKDISAGIVVGIMLVPQAIAYSMVASLPAQYG
jgi:hypothetical protein